MAKEKKLKISDAIVHIGATFNNTIVTFTDRQGNTISWSSAGKCNFKGARKNTPHAASVTAEDAGKKALEFGVKNIAIIVRGPGSGRDSAIRTLLNLGFMITEIEDDSGIPFNGCRQRKERRV